MTGFSNNPGRGYKRLMVKDGKSLHRASTEAHMVRRAHKEGHETHRPLPLFQKSGSR